MLGSDCFQDKIIKIGFSPIEFAVVAVFGSEGEMIAERPIDPARNEIRFAVFEIPASIDTDVKPVVRLPFDIDVPFWNNLRDRAFVEKGVCPYIDPNGTVDSAWSFYENTVFNPESKEIEPVVAVIDCENEMAVVGDARPCEIGVFDIRFDHMLKPPGTLGKRGVESERKFSDSLSG